MESDYRYYSRRAAEERQRARSAVTNAARERHLDLAASFTQRAEQRSVHNVVAQITTFANGPRILVAED